MGYFVAYLLGIITALKPSHNSKTSPPPVESAEKSCKCCHHKAPWWKVLLDILTFFAAVSAAGAATWYACITRNMWTEMQTQSKTAQQQLEATTRPWIAVDFAIAGPITFDANGATIRFSIQVNNIGHSPALNTDVLPKIINEAQIDPPKIQRECAKDTLPQYVIDQNLSSWGESVFMERPLVKPFALSIPPDQLDKQFAGFPKGTIASYTVQLTT